MNIEILYLAWNRVELTKISFATLRAHTDWSLVDRLVVYDDGSEDGTAEFLEEAIHTVPVPAELRRTEFRSPPAIMNDYCGRSEADAFMKIDNDIGVPPEDWLPVLVELAGNHRHHELFGVDAGFTGVKAPPGHTHSIRTARHIGGIGLMRVSAFRTRSPIQLTVSRTLKERRDGFTHWQRRRGLVACWVTPDFSFIQMDKIPEQPYRGWSTKYVAKGWQRRWPPYDPVARPWWEWLDDYLPADLPSMTLPR